MATQPLRTEDRGGPCPVCRTGRRPENMLMCRVCWKFVSKPTADNLYKQWNRGRPTKDHPAARRAALAEARAGLAEQRGEQAGPPCYYYAWRSPEVLAEVGLSIPAVQLLHASPLSPEETKEKVVREQVFPGQNDMPDMYIRHMARDVAGVRLFVVAYKHSEFTDNERATILSAVEAKAREAGLINDAGA